MSRVFSGVQPTADAPHLGNYIGAFRHWIDLARSHESFYCVVDLHTLTVAWDAATLARRTRQTAASLIASGIDPEKSTLFVQSEVVQHAELAWILICLARMGELGRMTQFKDKSRNQDPGAVGVGLFTYPALMAADVLAYRAELVPIGDDQKQHLELMRDIAERFNQRFGDTFPVPDPVIAHRGARIMALDDPTAKMAKSSGGPNNVIWMTDSPDEVKKKISRAVTDSGREIVYSPEKPAISNLLEIYSAVSGREIDELVAGFEGKGYADLKQGLTDALVEFLSPFQARYGELLADPAELDALLDRGAESAREEAEKTMLVVREAIGLRSRHIG